MRFKTTLLMILLALALGNFAQAQEGTAFIYYAPNEANTNLPLGCPCQAGTPYADGTATWYVFWDNNDNGPDAADNPVPIGHEYGQANYNNGVFNGVLQELGAGYFATDDPIAILQLPEGNDHPRYYIQVSTTGANSCCWRTSSFTITTGLQEIYLQWADWTCLNQACATTQPAPSAPTAPTATNGECMSIGLTWAHDGNNLSGFNIYMDGTFLTARPSADRSFTASVTTCADHVFSITAYGPGGESAHSSLVTGSAYMLRLDPAQANHNNLAGYNHHGQQFCLMFQQPNPTCYTRERVYLIRDGVRLGVLAGDSLVTQQCFTLPADTSLNHLRFLLVATAVDNDNIMCTDTTDSIFSLGPPPSAIDPQGGLLPDHFSLQQNFPNPFNPTTTIRFSVPFTSVVKIQVFNIQGQLVRTLTNEEFSSGVYNIEWDSRSDAGLTVGTGLYLCRMTGPDFSETHKMLLLK